jgi:hypothetical protein
MPLILRLTGTSFNQPIIKKLKVGDDITIETNADDSDSEVEDLDGGQSSAAFLCKHNGKLIGYVPSQHKPRVRKVLKDGEKFKIFTLHTFNDITGVRIKSLLEK